ncbi:uncharacterized protein LOC115767563 [Drosophila novamexicana]|uniref:uncharacterized protein LOC115767563 n=1 Tax=Drosophila novamexicana TaxID=47314 RepID=UPI0011E5EEE7|nr:uncharacterized protein LOC115767563 [Drosophila novamexicana]
MSDLAVVGEPLRVGDKFVPQLSMRRIFNTKCFRVERHQHEVANHYRDFKLQQSSLPPRRSCHLARQPRRIRSRLQRPSFASPCAQFRGELPAHVHYFPRFGDTYAPRGRQTICSAEPPDDTYNDTLRRIRCAHSSDQLKALVERVESLQRQQQQQQRHRRIDLCTYLQLASGYYERGLHANIKYLQSIGQRNAINQQQQLQQQRQQQQQRHRQRRFSLEAWPQQQTVDDQSQQHLSTFLKNLRQRERCQTLPDQCCTTDAISVHITPVLRAATDMCDYARQCGENSNNNIESNSSSSSDRSSSSTNSALTAAIDQRKLYEIIDNLSELSLRDNSLPLITLTDYTQQVALYGANLDIAGDCLVQTPNETEPPT